MSLTSIQKKTILIASILGGLSTIIGVPYSIYTWVDSTIVTKSYLDVKMLEVEVKILAMEKTQKISAIEISLRMIDESLAIYHRIGKEKLNDVDLHRYNKLILEEQFNDKQRKDLLGL